MENKGKWHAAKEVEWQTKAEDFANKEAEWDSLRKTLEEALEAEKRKVSEAAGEAERVSGQLGQAEDEIQRLKRL